jgi:hypothetical protein
LVREVRREGDREVGFKRLNALIPCRKEVFERENAIMGSSQLVDIELRLMIIVIKVCPNTADLLF